jgi:hypothetical protein
MSNITHKLQDFNARPEAAIFDAAGGASQHHHDMQ